MLPTEPLNLFMTTSHGRVRERGRTHEKGELGGILGVETAPPVLAETVPPDRA